MTQDATGEAHYVFRVRFRVEPSVRGVSVDPATFETTMHRQADPPGEEGWLFFRDNLWRGELGDEDYLREVTEDALGVPVTSVSFSELRTGEEYLEELRAEIGENLGEFRAATIEEALTKYLGSSIRVVRDTD
jgi:hypothetical protein